VQRALGLPADALEDSHAVLRDHGNMSSPTVLAILERRLARDAHAWPCVMLAFGPGLTAEAAVLRAE
jgi:predicted naringenin-chalcone synthase